MFFIFFPTGLIRPLRHIPVVSIVIIFAILYRSIAAGALPSMQVNLVGYIPVQEWDLELLSAILQSYFSPAFPAGAVLEHSALMLLSVGAAILFWIIFGAALEDDLGRPGLAALYLGGGAAGLLLLVAPIGAISGAFWLGHAATITAIGTCYVLHTHEDFRISYLFWWIFGGASNGHWQFPTIFALIPLTLFLIAGQSIFWYDPQAPVIPLRDGPMLPMAWNILLIVAGAALGISIKEWRKARNARQGETAPEEGFA